MKKTLISLVFLFGSVLFAHAVEGRLLRFPTTDGENVVFSYAGDLYKVPLAGGRAVRLTTHAGYEMFAKYSPDGSTIAFTAQYDGNTEVYIMPAEGGEPVRLTYTSTNARDEISDRMGPNNIVMAWTPDGEKIVYRNRIGNGLEGQLWVVSKNGGMPERFELPEGGFCSFSPDGKKFVYNRLMREFRTWKYYRGGQADDIWLYDKDKNKVTNLTENPAQDIIPMWVGDKVYFLSDRDMRMNLFVYDTKSGSVEKVTDYKDFDIKFPSSDGKIIVYEKGGYLYTYSPAEKADRKIKVELVSDNVYARTEIRDVSDKVSSVSITPDGKQLAVTARGEVFTLPAGKGVTKNISRTPGGNERNAQWSPDGKNVAYIGDVTGESEIWMVNADGESIQLTRNNDTYIRDFIWSPDSRRIVYTDRKNRIVEVNVEKKSKKTIQEYPGGEFWQVDYSPDSKWLTYTKRGSNGMAVVYVYNFESGKEFPVTEKWYNSSNPTFSRDGKYLFFTSNRDLAATYSHIEWNYGFYNMGGIYFAILENGRPSPFMVGYKKEKKPEQEQSAAPAVTIDTDGLCSRIVKVQLPAGNYYNLYADDDRLWFGNNGNVVMYDLPSQEQKIIVNGGGMTVPYNSTMALINKGSDFYIQNIPAAQAALNKPVELTGLTTTVDYQEEWAQIYDETWRAFRDGFYLENMHGVDWKAMKEKYAALLPYVKVRDDLNFVVGAMISELACGHSYINIGESKAPARIKMGLLGAEFSKGTGGFFKIERILKGDVYDQSLRSPLTEQGLDVHEGDFVTAINGISTATVDNIYKLLIGRADVYTEISINSKASLEGSRNIVVKPISDEYPLYHFNWVKANIEKVEKATGGRVGYLYLPDMGKKGISEFARYYYPQLDKEALIIDERSNGGGNVSPMIIERLLRKPYRMTMGRGTDMVHTVPDGTHVGPKVLLIDKYSSSDGDLFPWSFQANKIGTIIGTRTWGGIIGIGGSLPYMDGTNVRVPGSTNYDTKTGKWIVENHGVDPDIVIDNDPIKVKEGIDQQLDKAIEVILEQLKDRKPMPGVPAPRTFKDLGL